MRRVDSTRLRLIAALKGARAPHAVFIDCTDTPLTTLVARSAAAQFCLGSQDTEGLMQYPDYREIDGDIIKIDAIRGVIEELSKRSFTEGSRAVFLPRAHRMNESAQNALLKTLEEPPDNTLFLLAGNRAGLLPTICSRCHTLHLAPTAEDVADGLVASGASASEARLYSAEGTTLMRAQRLFLEQDYRVFRDTALTAITALLYGKSAFEYIKPLSADVEGCVNFMSDFVGDMVSFVHTGKIFACEDRRDDIVKLSPRFTTGELNCIILLMADAMRRESVAHAPGAALDRLFSELLAMTRSA